MKEQFLEKTEFASYEEFQREYRLHYPQNFNFAIHVVDEWAKLEPEKRALEWCNDHGENRSFTFADISELSKRAAFYLKSLGIGKGDRVLVLLGRRWEYWVTAVALHRIGAVLIPASCQLTAKDIRYRVNAAQVQMIIAFHDGWIVSQVERAVPDCKSLRYLALVAGKRKGWMDFSSVLENPVGKFLADETLTVRDNMLIYFTSGTSGMPKMVVHDYSYPLGHLATACYWQNVQENGLHLTGVDSGWAKFGWGCIYGQWMAGCAVLGYDCNGKFNPQKMLEVIRKKKPTSLCVPATVYRFFMKAGVTKGDFSSISYCCTAGEPLSPEITREFQKLTGLTIHEGFGQSESSVLVANYPWFEPKPGSMGKPSPLYDIALVRDDGTLCAPGEEGELVVRNLDQYYPEGLLRGYWKDGKLTPVYDKNYVYHTGDIAWQDEEGYFWFIGRNDDIIKCSGYRIGPFEIESVLMTHPAVQECAITGAPHPIRGQVVKATIVLSDGYRATDRLTKEIQDYVKQMTAPYKYPRVVEYTDHLEKTTSGKIIRRHLRTESKSIFWQSNS